MPAQPLWSPTWKLDHVGVRAPPCVAAQPHLPWCALCKLRADGGSFASQHFLAWSARGRAAFSPPARQMDGLCRHSFLVCSDCLTWHRPPFPRNSVSRHLAGMTPLTNKVVRFLLMLVTAVLARREHQFFYSCCLVRSYLTA